MSQRLSSSLLSRLSCISAGERSFTSSAAFHIEALESRIAPASTAAALFFDQTTTSSEGSLAAAEEIQVSLTKAPTGDVLENPPSSPVTFTFQRTGPTTETLAVNFDVGGTATLGTDYTKSGPGSFSATAGTVTFAPGSSSVTITITPVGDSILEPDETVAVTLAPGTGYGLGTPSSATATILNDDYGYEISVAPAGVAEDGNDNLVFTITKTGALSFSPLAFMVGGTAIFNTDYTQTGTSNFSATSGFISFTTGQRSATVTIDPIAEGDVEGDETVTLTLNGPYTIIGTGTATGTITNDDAQVSLTVAPGSVLEDGSTNLVYSFTRTGLTTNPLTVNFNVGGTATHTSDYTQAGAASFSSLAGTVVIPAGSATATVTLDPVVDMADEGDETVSLMLAGGSGYVVGNSNAVTGTIIDDERLVTLALTPSSVLEDGAANLVYTFTRMGSVTQPLTVNFGVSGSALLGTDYTQSGAGTFGISGGTITFAPGSATTTLTIDPTLDTALETDETVSLTLQSGAGYLAGTAGPVAGNILNDDVQVSVAVAPASVLEDGTQTLVYTFTRTGNPASPLSANFTVGGTATFTTDYMQTGTASFTESAGSVLFPVGANTVSVTLDPSGDSLGEVNETIILSVINGTGYTVVNPPAVGTIVDDDVEISVSPPVATMLEDGGVVALTFHRTGSTESIMTYNFDVSGTAISTVDYTATGRVAINGTLGTVTFVSGFDSATVFVRSLSDTLVEADKTVQFTLRPGTGYTVGTSNASEVTIVDDDTIVDLTGAAATMSEGSHAGLVYTVSRGLANPAKDVEVRFTVDGTAVASSDYQIAGAATFAGGSGTVIIPAGSATATLSILPIDDTLVEGAERLSIAIGSGSGYVPGQSSQANATITDNDTATIEFKSPASTLKEGVPMHEVEAMLVVTANGIRGVGSLTREVSVSVRDLLTGTAGVTDYTFIGPAVVSFPAGSGGSTQKVFVSTAGDALQEESETVVLGLGPIFETTGQVTLGSTVSHTVSIVGVQRAVDLQVNASTAATRAVPGQALVYTINVSNAGSSDATGVVLTETLPIGTTFDAAGSSPGWTETTPGTFTLSIGTVAGNSEETPILFATHVNSAQSASRTAIANVISVSDDATGGADPTPFNNSATVSSPLYRGLYAFSLGGTLPQVKAYDLANGTLVLDFPAYENTMNSGVRVAVGDLNGDGVDDIVTSTGNGTGRIRAFDGTDGTPLAIGNLAEINPFGVRANRGAFIAVGDVTGDGRDDIVAGAGTSGRQVKIYNGLTGELTGQFIPFASATGGLRVATGDLNGDGVADIIVGQASGGSGVRAYAGGSFPSVGAPELLLKTRLTGSDGVHLAAADVTGDAKLELLLGSGDQSPSRLVVYSPEMRSVLYETSSFGTSGGRGLRVAAADIDFDGIAEIIATPGGKSVGRVSFLNGSDGTIIADRSLQPFPTALNTSVFVAGSRPMPAT